MASKITCDVLDAQQHCRLKAHFRLCGEEGTKSDFETLLFDARQELRLKALEKIRRQYAEGEVETDIALSRSVLRKGIPFILHGHLEDDRYAIRFDGLKKVDGASIIGEFSLRAGDIQRGAVCSEIGAASASDQVNSALSALREDGSYQKVHDKWFTNK